MSNVASKRRTVGKTTKQEFGSAHLRIKGTNSYSPLFCKQKEDNVVVMAHLFTSTSLHETDSRQMLLALRKG
eukprot:11430226-Ditylum_brightwellii.AAC.1